MKRARIKYTRYKLLNGSQRAVRLYRSWLNMKNRVAGRVTDGNGKAIWKGLEIGFKDFWHFREWALRNGYGKGLVLDRKRSTEGYAPDNCQWITMTQNANRARMRHKVNCACFWCKQKRGIT